ncbi:MAG: 30S ribosomal protein S8 [Actinobacteria bacterium]|nr:30S ribosomal protein S8 [Actinomycetota bacterium]
MTMTDPIADMLTRLRNATTAGKDDVVMPSSKLKEQIALILEREGYVEGVKVEGDVKRTLTMVLKYGPQREKTISGVKRVSKPGRRVYAANGKVPRVQGGLGLAIISTSDGLLTDRQAKKKGVGGEVLAYVW